MDKKTVKEVMRYLGKKKSAKKTKACRENGIKGGLAYKAILFEKRNVKK